ncbi:hypothetical protein [Catenuloplanes indicus]|uniref:Uncharacterized protein n=1 Tax=Catenuloplanes indicus TaxID=137267 RepID=A0AAE4B0J0_9ACTN|nr:hypothetical protein [Catenuloplanes indicus]MDQ0366858.1 hypothetical protein [Catenuloplanes indicus]
MSTPLPPQERHPDTVLLDRLTAFINSSNPPSGADVVQLLCELLDGSGRPVVSEPWEMTAEVVEDAYGIPAAVVTAGGYTVRLFQHPIDQPDLRIEVHNDTPITGQATGPVGITVGDRPVLTPRSASQSLRIDIGEVPS